MRPQPAFRPHRAAYPISLSRTAFVTTLVIIVAAGGALRVLAGLGELWLDEIWSFRVARLLTGPLGVFNGIHSDNNHHLNSLYLRLVPEGTASWVAYRLHSIVAGTGAIVLGALIARRAGDVASLGVATILASSYLLVVYSSEARGYSLAVFFAFACVLLADAYLQRPAVSRASLVGAAAALGILSQLTFLFAFAGLVAWTTSYVWSRRGWRAAAAGLMSLYWLPAAASLALYWVDLRHLTLGGGPPTSPASVAASALALTLGAPDAGAMKVLAVVTAGVGGVAAISNVRRSGSDLWILFLVTVVITPALALMVVDWGLVYERYLLVPVAFLLVSCAWLIARVSVRSIVLVGAILTVIVAGNALRTWHLVARGRGAFLPAMTYMATHASGWPVTVGSDHDFRIGRVLEFYRPFLPEGAALSYRPRTSWPPGGPEWLLVHDLGPEFSPRQEIKALGKYRYRLVQAYPRPGLSGWHLAVYRNAAYLQN